MSNALRFLLSCFYAHRGYYANAELPASTPCLVGDGFTSTARRYY